MSKWRIMISAFIIAGLIGFFSVEEPPAPVVEPVAQLVTGPPPKPVSNDELEIYLDVYKSMQSDRDLTIDEAIKPHGLSLGEFRDLERRIQMRSTLVDRVRRELLAHAEEISVFDPGLTKAAPAQAPPAAP